MTVSVIIPTRNRAAVLAGALDALARQDAPRERYEVLVVDNGSNDNTREVAESARAALPSLRYVHEPRPGLHCGRHRGMREAAGEVLGYIDDDVIVGPAWVATLLSAFADPKVGLVGGNNLPRFAERPPAWLQRRWDRPYGDGHAIPYLSVVERKSGPGDMDPSLVWGCNFSVRKEVLAEARGFHPDAMPDELIRFRGDGEMPVGRHVVASGRRCLFHPGASVEHLVPASRMTHDYFRRRAFLQGISDSYTELRAQHLLGTPPRPDPLGFARGLLNPLERSRRAGMRYHRDAFAADAQVRAWVLRADYLDDADA